MVFFVSWVLTRSVCGDTQGAHCTCDGAGGGKVVRRRPTVHAARVDLPERGPSGGITAKPGHNVTFVRILTMAHARASIRILTPAQARPPPTHPTRCTTLARATTHSTPTRRQEPSFGKVPPTLRLFFMLTRPGRPRPRAAALQPRSLRPTRATLHGRKRSILVSR